MGEGYSSHVGVVGCFVVVGEEFSAIVVCESIFDIELELKVVLELLVTGAFIINFTQTGPVE
jgi:hypothetical protein